MFISLHVTVSVGSNSLFSTTDRMTFIDPICVDGSSNTSQLLRSNRQTVGRSQLFRKNAKSDVICRLSLASAKVAGRSFCKTWCSVTSVPVCLATCRRRGWRVPQTRRLTYRAVKTVRMKLRKRLSSCQKFTAVDSVSKYPKTNG